MRKQEHILVSLNVSRYVSLIVGNVCSLALLSFCKLCQKFAVTSENFLKTCIALEQVSCGGTSTRLLVLHEFACICKYDNNIVVALQALRKQSNTELCTCNFRA